MQWCFISNTNKKYILTNTGRVFSASLCDYLKPDVKRYLYYVKIKFDTETKPKNTSVKHLLQNHFPNSLQNKEYWMDVESKQHDEEVLKELKRKGYISK